MQTISHFNIGSDGPGGSGRSDDDELFHWFEKMLDFLLLRDISNVVLSYPYDIIHQFLR